MDAADDVGDDFHVGVGAGEEVGDVADAEFVEVDFAAGRFDAEEDAEHFLQERAGEVVGEVVFDEGRPIAGNGAAAGEGKRP